MTEELYLSIGGNIENRFRYITAAEKSIEKEIGELVERSSVYETDSWGFDAPSFLNRVIRVKTGFTPQEVIDKALLIEKTMGRARNNSTGYNNRIIDIDILFYGTREVREENLIVPHPKIQERKFVLIPMNEIAPGFVHPVYLKSIAELLRVCRDKLTITKVEKI